MILTRHTRQNGILRVQPPDEGVDVHRVDWYGKPARWFWETSEEVEIWELPDGRQVRASRKGNEDWQLQWRAA